MNKYKLTIIRNHLLEIYKQWQKEEPDFFLSEKETKTVEKSLIKLDFDSNIYFIQIWLLFDSIYNLNIKSARKIEIMFLLQMLFEGKKIMIKVPDNLKKRETIRETLLKFRRKQEEYKKIKADTLESFKRQFGINDEDDDLKKRAVNNTSETLLKLHRKQEEYKNIEADALKSLKLRFGINDEDDDEYFSGVLATPIGPNPTIPGHNSWPEIEPEKNEDRLSCG